MVALAFAYGGSGLPAIDDWCLLAERHGQGLKVHIGTWMPAGMTGDITSRRRRLPSRHGRVVFKLGPVLDGLLQLGDSRSSAMAQWMQHSAADD